MPETCPKTVDLSAYVDQQLGAVARAELGEHIERCATCAAMLADLRALRDGLQRLPDERLGFDLSQVIRGRIAAEAGVPRAPRRHRSWRDLAPLGVGAAAAMSLGLAMGLALTAGSGVAVAPRFGAMAVFDPVAPGGLCIGHDACYAPRGADRGLAR